MHVMHINFVIDRERRVPDKLLHDWYSLVEVAGSAVSANVRVSVAQASLYEARVEREGAQFYFVPPDSEHESMIEGRAFRLLVDKLQPEVFHAHGLGFPRETAALHALAPHVPVILQDHADRLPRFFWRRASLRRGLAQVSGVVFCAQEQALPFVESGVLPRAVRVFEYAGTSTRFMPGDQAQARTVTGVYGDPCVLWVGHLNSNKDPLTILRGLRDCVAQLPDLHLWCCFGTAPLMDAVRREIAQSPSLVERVHLLGDTPHERIEHFMRAADVFVLGSHREGSGVSLIESLAAGLPPAVSDIPSFRAITGQGAVGALWKCGDSQAFSRALLAVAAQPRGLARTAARAHFEKQLSFAAGGARLRDAYRDLVEQRGTGLEQAVT
jgi:glycosyltransferase involved in cell wall biosynthesis